jgi:DNA-binding CsgD family transcriptional regulator
MGLAEEALVGRGPELALIDAFVERAADVGEALVLFGEPGIGKTVLLDSAAQAALAAGTQVIRASGVEFETELTFSGLHQVLLPLRGDFVDDADTDIDALKVALGLGAGRLPDGFTVSNSTLAVLRNASASRPLLFVVDDLQWLDRASATVLAFTARRLTGSPVGFLGATRSGEESFFEHAGIPELEVLPLETDSARDLVDTRFPSLAPQVRQRVVLEARGNPLALLELPPYFSTSRGFSPHGSPGVSSPGRRLQGLFLSKIASLSDGARYLLLLAALDGSGDLAVLPAGAGFDDFDEAERAGLIRVDAATRRVLFRHPLVRTSVVAGSTADERRRAHRALGAQYSDQPERRAWHLAEASLQPDENVASLLQDAAHHILRRGDAPGAVAALTRASELTPDNAMRRRRLAEAAYVGSGVTGTLSDASNLLLSARDGDLDATGSLYASTAAAYLLVNGDGDVDTAYRLLIRTIEHGEDDPCVDPAALEEAFHALALLCYFGGRGDLWKRFEETLAHFPPPLPLALYLASTVFADPCHASVDALARLDRAIEGLTEQTDPITIMRIANTSVFVDRLSDCRQALWRVVRDGRAGGVVALAITALSLLAMDDVTTGRWEEADQLADESVELCQRHGYGLMAWPGKQTKAVLAAIRGEYETTQTLTDQMMRWATPRRARVVHAFSNLALHYSAMGRGDFEAAYQLAAAITPAGQLPPYGSTAVYCLMGLVEAAVRTNRHSEAAAHVGAMQRANIAAISPKLALYSASSAAMAAPDEQAAGLFEQALAVPGVDRFPFDVARVQLAYGEHLRRNRSIADARRHLTAAAGTFERLGARPWAGRAASELRATGLAKPLAERSQAESLTPQELEIARLAATGMTNKQIGLQLHMSPRTVGTHLYRVFPKLGIASRAALRDALNRQQEMAEHDTR